MNRRKKLIIAILTVVLIGMLLLIVGSLFFSGPDLNLGDKNILVLASDKGEQQGGSVDMGYIISLKNGSIANYTPFYPGGMHHPTQSSRTGSGMMLMHDCLWDGTEKGAQYAKEIVEYNSGIPVDAVVIVYTEGIDAVIDSVRPLKIDGKETNLSAQDIIRENDAYSGYVGSHANVKGNMSRADAVMVLVKALSETAKDPAQKSKMINAALDQYSKGNILMYPEGSFTRLLATKGIENLAG